jgi:hypothetical protein
MYQYTPPRKPQRPRTKRGTFKPSMLNIMAFQDMIICLPPTIVKEVRK